MAAAVGLVFAETVDVLVVGAGPAGATAALQLAGHCSVAMVGREPLTTLRTPLITAQATVPVIGESLPAAARVLLHDLGLWPQFVAQGHRPAWSHVSLWGDTQPVQRDAMLDPHGHGWHLDRVRFDALLREAAVQRGARWLGPGEVRNMTHTLGASWPWRCTVESNGAPRLVQARLLVDASGRAARVVRHAGAKVQRLDRLVCLHTWLPAQAEAAQPAWPGATLIEAAAHGWWYSAELPNGRSVLAFHTDADLPSARACKSASDLLQKAQHETRLIRARCPGAVGPDALFGVAPAHSQCVQQAAGADWLAVGDAALAFDPLASQGLLNSLYTGMDGAAATLRYLGGDAMALPGWVTQVQGITQAYARNLSAYYVMAQRWPQQTFWQRRAAPVESMSVRPPRWQTLHRRTESTA